MNNLKCVMVIDETVPRGIIANTAAIMGITLGKNMPDIVGTDVTDINKHKHLGITEIPIPILKGNAQLIQEIRNTLYLPEYSDIVAVDFSDIAQGCKTYEEFIFKMNDADENSLRYLGIGIIGDKKKINSLTGNLGLLR